MQKKIPPNKKKGRRSPWPDRLQSGLIKLYRRFRPERDLSAEKRVKSAMRTIWPLFQRGYLGVEELEMYYRKGWLGKWVLSVQTIEYSFSPPVYCLGWVAVPREKLIRESDGWPMIACGMEIAHVAQRYYPRFDPVSCPGQKDLIKFEIKFSPSRRLPGHVIMYYPKKDLTGKSTSRIKQE